MFALKPNVQTRAKVLIVEDEALIARDLEATLEDMGYAITGLVASSREALESASEHCPDVALMDIRLRGEPDGIETASVLRERFRVPVVYVTAHADDETLERAAHTRPYGYLVKPFKAAEVKSVIELALHRHAVDTKLAERERWLSTTVQAISDAVIACDNDERVRFMNPAAEKLTGWTQEEAIGRDLEEVFQLVSRQTGESIDNPVKSALSARQDASNVRTIAKSGVLKERKGDSERIVDNAVARRVVDDGDVHGAVLVFRDATERSRLAERAEVAERLGSLGTMAASVAHEINNPLTFNLISIGFALRELREARRVARDAKAIERLDLMIDALSDAELGAERIGRIVGDLRELSRSTSQPPETIDVRTCVRQAIKLASNQLSLSARLVQDLQQVPQCLGNDVRLSQVVVNLLVNAAQSLTGRPENNEIRVVTKTSSDGGAIIEVHDTGSGIAPEILDRVFDPFFTTKHLTKGTGLGLAISRGIVKSLGGELTVESRVGAGSCFRVLLPPHRDAEALPSEQWVTPTPRKRARILLIDDEPLLRKALHWMLECDHDVVIVESAEKALSILEARRDFDLILCDLMMPHIGGMDLYEELLRTHPEIAARTVFMTGGAFQPRVAEFVMKMHGRCIQKPFNRARLLAFVEQMLS